MGRGSLRGSQGSIRRDALDPQIVRESRRAPRSASLRDARSGLGGLLFRRRTVKIHLLYFRGCPQLEAAREVLDQALSQLEARPIVLEFDVMDPRTPPELRSWGSPTILVDGLDVIGGFPSDPCCRVYCDGEQKGPPPLAAIEDALRRSAATRKQSF